MRMSIGKPPIDGAIAFVMVSKPLTILGSFQAPSTTTKASVVPLVCFFTKTLAPLPVKNPISFNFWATAWPMARVA